MNRKAIIIQIIVVAIGLIFIVKLYVLQVIDKTYKTRASDIGRQTIYPARGLIFDRNEDLIVVNKPIYDLLVVQKELDNTNKQRFAALLDIPTTLFDERMDRLEQNSRMYSRYKPETFISQISARRLAPFEDHFYEFPGFYIQTRSARKYPFYSGAHLLGYIAEVNKKEIDRSEKYYSSGDYIGKTGLERYYEEELRGKRGIKYYLKDHLNRNIGSFNKGAFDTAAVAGRNIVTTIDVSLQQYGEELMNGKKGSIVAIEPATGEILAMITSPSYDPNLLVGSEIGENYLKLQSDTTNIPLIHRHLLMYPPGSTLKPLLALIGLQEKAITQYKRISCTGGGYFISGLHIGCHGHPVINTLNRGIQYSCNAYFCDIFKLLIESKNYRNESFSLEKWVEYMHAFNLGKKLNVDLFDEKRGNIPDSTYYNKIYPNYRWKASTIISLGIGQGEILTTPLQLANLYAIIANRGFYYYPHLVRSVEGGSDKLDIYDEKQVTPVDPSYFELIQDGLEKSISSGTARLAYMDSIPICGKTGTSENPHGEDHSLFAAYAPRNSPRIAIAVVVENAGFGGSWAAPIASLMIEKYIKGYISPKREWIETRILEKNFLEEE